MSNNQSDGFYTKAPKPTDVKAFVGDVALMEFATKESIPISYRFEGMLVQESLLSVIKTYRLEGGVADINYIEQLFNTGEVNTASNLGAGTGVFYVKSSLDLEFKSLIAGSNIGLSNTANDITIAFTGTLLPEAPIDGTTYGRNNGAWAVIASGGTVTSVAITGSDGIQVDSGSPITGSGTIALGLHKVNTLAFLNVEDGADVTDASNVSAAGAVMNTGSESISGVKTFGSFPITPSSAPATDYQVSNKKYVDDNIAAIGRQSTSTLSALNVSGLGSTYTLLSSPAVGSFYKIFGITVRLTNTVTLDVGSQTLDFSYNGKTLASLSEASLESTAPIDKLFHVYLEAATVDAEIDSATAFTMKLSGSVNPASGSATMKVMLHYTIETL